MAAALEVVMAAAKAAYEDDPDDSPGVLEVPTSPPMANVVEATLPPAFVPEPVPLSVHRVSSSKDSLNSLRSSSSGNLVQPSSSSGVYARPPLPTHMSEGALVPPNISITRANNNFMDRANTWSDEVPTQGGMLGALGTLGSKTRSAADVNFDPSLSPSMPRPRLGSMEVRETSTLEKYRDPDSGMRRINQYAIHEELGRGAHGKVKKCTDLGDPASPYYAMKIMRKRSEKSRFAGRDDQNVSVNREIAILKKCCHPNVVRLFEVIDNPEFKKVYLILEYMERGEVVWQTPEGRPAMSEAQAREYFRDVLLGLEYLHYQGVIHRDLKPGNLLVTADNHLAIADFGLSHIMEDQEADAKELVRVLGSPAFVAPELCASDDGEASSDGQLIGKAIDVWALGVTLYCFLYGRVPYTSDSGSAFEVYQRIRKSDLVFDPSVSVSLSAQLLIRRLLDKNPATRISLPEVKGPQPRCRRANQRHSWILVGLDDPERWLDETNPARSDPIQVSEEDESQAYSFYDKVKSRLRRLSVQVAAWARGPSSLRRSPSPGSANSASVENVSATLSHASSVTSLHTPANSTVPSLASVPELESIPEVVETCATPAGQSPSSAGSTLAPPVDGLGVTAASAGRSSRSPGRLISRFRSVRSHSAELILGSPPPS